MYVTLVCVGGPFDGREMPLPESGSEIVIPNFLLAQSEVFGRIYEAVLGDDERNDDPQRIGDLIKEHGDELRGGSTSASLYRVHAESFLFVRTLSNAEWREWTERQRREE